jgi:hypothetical protein
MTDFIPMKILSAKNKKTSILVLAILGGLVLASAIYGAVKGGARSAGDIFKYIWERIKSVISFNSVVILLAAGACLLVPGVDGFSYAVALGTLTTGAAVVTTFNTQYIPKFFSYTAATQLTGVKITVAGAGVIFDSDAAGLNHWGVNRLQGQLTNTYTFMLANSFIANKTVIWEFTNSAAQTPTVYIESDETLPKQKQYFLQGLRTAVLANSGANFRDFATLSFPSIAAADVLNVVYADGTQQPLNRQDVLERLQKTQNVINTPVYMLDNWTQNIREVNIMAAAAQTAYIQRWAPAHEGMINMSI